MEKCELCGEPMAESESMFKFHGYSGPCPKPPLKDLTPQKDPIPHAKFMQDLRYLLLSNGFWFDELKADQEAALVEGFAKALKTAHPACVAREPSGTCVYLRDGTKVVIHKSPAGSAYLTVEKQAVIKAQEPFTDR